MANEKNLKPFTSKNQPKNRGRKKGIPNRATILKKWLEAKATTNDLSGKAVDVSGYDAAALGVIKAAMSGNPRAFQEIQDTLFGKQSIKVNFSPEELQNLTDEELDSLINQYER